MVNRPAVKKPLPFKKNTLDTYHAVYSGGVKYPLAGVQAISLLHQIYELYVGVVEVRNQEIGGMRLCTIEIPIAKIQGKSKPHLELLAFNMKQMSRCPFQIVDDSEVICLTWNQNDFDEVELFLSDQIKQLNYINVITQGNRSLLENKNVRNCIERIIRVIGFPEALKICSRNLTTGILILEFTLGLVGDGKRSQYMKTKIKEALDDHCKECNIRKTRGFPSFWMAIHL